MDRNEIIFSGIESSAHIKPGFLESAIEGKPEDNPEYCFTKRYLTGIPQDNQDHCFLIGS
ncbi:MAG: hypothetical protein Q7J03_01670 [Methanoregula sp.]|nr:hypothetical protein [Methanoregula sp.]